MGLFDMDGVEEGNKRGRPKKKEGDGKREPTGNTVTTVGGVRIKAWEHDPEHEAFLEKEFKKLKAEYDDDIGRVIQELADKICVGNIAVRKKLAHYEIYETDWEEYIDEYVIYEKDLRIPINEPTESRSSFSSSSSDDDDKDSFFKDETGDEKDSGLAGLVNKEKS